MSNRFARSFSHALTLFAVAFVVVRGPATRAAEANAEAEARLSTAINFLASDDLDGRGVGGQGIDKAADYLANEFKQLGLKTELYDGTPFQPFKINIGARLGEGNEATLIGPASTDGKPREIPLALNQDFTPLPLGGSGDFDLPLAFVGYGITAKDLAYDDYAGIDVNCKAVIVLRHEPQQDNPHSKFDGTKTSDFAPLSRKLSNAYEHGARAVIFVSTEHGVLKELRRARERWQQAVDELSTAHGKFKETEHPSLTQLDAHQQHVAKLTAKIAEAAESLKKETDAVLKFRGGMGEETDRDFPVLHSRRAPIDQLLEAALGTNLATLEHEIDQDLTPHSRDLPGWHIKGKTAVIREQAQAKNVVAVLEGEGPLADETIVIGAHYDHLGHGGAGSLAPGSEEIHNGADDNGSGTVALIEVARRLAARPQKLPRRIVFIAFTGEERGLLGSAHYVKDPLIPLDKTIAMLNMDMVGRLKDDKLIVYGTGTSDQLEKTLEQANEHYGFNLAKQPAGFGPSDQTSFYAKKIPVLHFFTGIHPDYHRPSDDADKINVAGMARIVDMVVDVATAVAEAPERPQYKSTGAQSSLGGGGDRPYFGSIPEFGKEDPGYAISGVTKDSPAEKGGLAGGDVIIQIGDSKIGNLEDFDSALRKHKAGDKIPVVVRRDGKDVKLEVTLEPPR